MKFRFFNIPALVPESAEGELNRFMAGHRVASVEKEFVPDGSRSYWAVCVTYSEERAGVPAPATRKKTIDYREVLDEPSFAVFAQLRTLRKIFSEQEGVPDDALFTNEQLADMVRNNVSTMSALAAIDGVGKMKLEKYGAAFLDLLNRQSGTDRDPGNQNESMGHEPDLKLPERIS